jgi:hypothetical protein
MARTEATSGVAVKILVKEYEITPIGIFGKLPQVSMPGAAAIRGRQKNADKPPGEFSCHLAQIHPFTGTGRELNLQTIAIKMVIALQRFY